MADQDTQNLRNEVEQLRSDLRSVTDTVKDIAAERGEQARARLREGAGAARDRAVRAEKAVEQQVEERPLASVLVVFIGGLITGLLLQNRR
jgi:ElaB/YqjD/DUF883 family membrane-anchored ribosome-binding protein